MVRVRVRVRAVLVSLNFHFLYPSIRVRTPPPVSVRVRNRVSVSFSFSGKLTLLTVGLLNLRIIDTEPVHEGQIKKILVGVLCPPTFKLLNSGASGYK